LYTRILAEQEVPQLLVLLRVRCVWLVGAFARRVEQISALGFARLGWGPHEMGVLHVRFEHRVPKSRVLPEVKR